MDMVKSFSDIKGTAVYKLPVMYSTLSPSERRNVRIQYIKLQKNKCWFCEQDLDGVPNNLVRSSKLNLNLFPAGFLRNPIHLHHCHNTDLTIGAVHAECNAYLWQYLGE